MGKIKHTKTELKAQSDALRRFERFLPMLQLKKQQLQAEIADITARLERVAAREREALDGFSRWAGLLAERPDDLASLVRVTAVRTSTGNIAGVAIPVFEGIETELAPIDLFATPPWFDEAASGIADLIAFRAERAVLERQRELIRAELQTTSQRVNLFEKVKIPECRENIRIIRIFIGDEQTAAVARGKIAKGRGTAPAPAVEAAE